MSFSSRISILRRTRASGSLGQGLPYFLFLLGSSLSFLALGQEPKSIPGQLQESGQVILQASQFERRDSANQFFREHLESFLRSEEGYDHPLDSVTNMLQIRGPRDEFRLFTWQMPDQDYELKRYGLIAVEGEDTIYVTHLQDALDELSDLQFGTYGPDQWPGALYYRLLPEGQSENRFTLLGYAPGEHYHRKIVEVLEIQEQGQVRFGGKMFRIEEYQDRVLNRPPMRLLFTYSADYSATVNWDEQQDKVIMDHLAPPSKKMKGLYRTYGPDFTYDALYWEDGWWHLEKEVEVTNP